MPKVLALDANNNTTEISLGDSIEWSLLTNVPVYATRWPTWDEVSGRPTTFPPAAHTHSASDITSGTLSDERLPSTMSGKTFNGDVGVTGRVTASEFANNIGTPGPKYFVGDDAALHDVNLPHTIGVRGISSPDLGYIKFGDAPGVIGWNGTTHIVETDLRVYGAVQGVRMLGGDVATNTYNPVCGGRNGQSNWNAAGLESFCTDGGWAVITLHRVGYSHVNLIHDGNESLYIGTDGNIGGVQLRANGEIWLGDANNRLNRRRQPRIFVQAGDPGAAAVDGDIWIQP